MTSKFIVFVIGSEDSESGKMPTTEEFAEMSAFNKPAQDAGIMVDAAGLVRSSKGAKLNFSEGSEPSVQHGPFGLENLVAGFWIVKFNSIEEVIEWAKGIPFKKGSVQIRKIAGAEDFGDSLPEDVKRQLQAAQEK